MGAVVQRQSNQNGASGTTLNSAGAGTPITVTAGNKLWIVANAGDSIVMTPTQNAGAATIGTITDQGFVDAPALNDRAQHWTCDITGSGTLDILITYASSTPQRCVVITEISGVGAIQGTAENTDTGDNPTPDLSVTVSAQPAFGLCVLVDYQSAASSAGSGWTLNGAAFWPGIFGQGIMQTRAITSTGATIGNFTNPTFARTSSFMIVYTDAGGADVNVNLTGQAATSAAGSMGNTHARAVTGQAATGAQGSVGNTRAHAITGQAATGAQGSVASTRAMVLTGQAATSALGTLTPAKVLALIGLGVTTSAGTVVAAVAAALTGQAATLQQGIISAGSNVTVALTGQAMTAAQGSLLRATALQLVGAAMAMGQGTVTTGGDITVTLTGQAMAAALGTVGVQRAAALAGSAATVAVGSVSSIHAAALTGQRVDMAPGTVAVLRALALLGIPATLSQGTLTAQQGTNVTVNLTGLAILAEQGLVVPEIAAALAGAAIEITAGTMQVYAPTVPVGTGAPLPSPLGTIATRNPVAIHLAGQGALVAGPYGVKLGRFAWANDAGQVSNARVADESLGFALMQAPIWGRAYWSDGALVLRAAQTLTMISAGDVWARFDGGAEIGAQVYAQRLDGAAVAGYAPHADPTPWYVATDAAPGGLAIISTWRKPPA